MGLNPLGCDDMVQLIDSSPYTKPSASLRDEDTIVEHVEATSPRPQCEFPLVVHIDQPTTSLSANWCSWTGVVQWLMGSIFDGVGVSLWDDHLHFDSLTPKLWIFLCHSIDFWLLGEQIFSDNVQWIWKVPLFYHELGYFQQLADEHVCLNTTGHANCGTTIRMLWRPLISSSASLGSLGLAIFRLGINQSYTFGCGLWFPEFH